jgi:hypothetical protein
MTNWVSKGEWRATEPVDRFKTLLDQTMTITVAGPPSREGVTGADGLKTAVDPGIDLVTGQLSSPDDWPPATNGAAPAPAVQTRWGLPDGTLTDPVMLGSAARLCFAGVCAFAVLAAIGGVIALAAGGTDGTAPYAVLGVLAAVSLAAIVVLTMGWKSVTIRSGSGGPAR